MSTLRALAPLLLSPLAFLALSAESCGDTHIIDDSGFDLWCGESLCNWEVHSGSVAKTGTWHKDDYAVEFVGNDVLISQPAATGARCARFEILADIDENAKLEVLMDYGDDGDVDYQQELAHAKWAPIVHVAPLPGNFSDIRFYLRKTGQGRVRIAQLEAIESSACDETTTRQNGSLCDIGSQCDSGICATSPLWGMDWLKVCSTCAGDAACGEGMVCGAPRFSHAYQIPFAACVPEVSAGLGEMCNSDGECTTGICENHRCSECKSSDDCSNDETCAPSTFAAPNDLPTPSLCESNGPGAPCYVDTDCASGVCEGGIQLTCSSDGRACRTSADCPPLASDLSTPPSCDATAVVEGSCQ